VPFSSTCTPCTWYENGRGQSSFIYHFQFQITRIPTGRVATARVVTAAAAPGRVGNSERMVHIISWPSGSCGLEPVHPLVAVIYRVDFIDADTSTRTR
jgi:hypothetical protein